ncbi:ABC transporter ATP-binding protein [Devosia sp.]|uniref:ABC transporter ATP-binding protein n=1 Tax=Devosia sp. TaxID=1871048 RepID=UPI003A8CBDB2
MSIKAKNLIWSAGGKRILNGVSLEARPGQMLGLLGPNGSGKSSLLRLLAGLRQPAEGKVTLDGRDMRQLSRKAIARRVALVEQHAATESAVRVRDVVALGRIPHQAMLAGATHADVEAVDAALARVGMQDRDKQLWQSLSGGERQRVHIARALAQAPRELLLDEPTNHLDIQHQIELLRLVSELKLTSVVALHDLNHAAMFCDRLMVMDGGRLVAEGTPAEVLTEALLAEIFRVKARVDVSPHHGRLQIHYLI